MQITNIVNRILTGAGAITPAEALQVLKVSDAETFSLVTEVGKIRRKFFSNTVKIHYLVSLKSGLCPEDCSYCSQRLGSKADILKYRWIETADAVKAALAGIAAGARKVCLVASGRGPSDKDVEKVGEIITQLRKENPNVEVCACLGILREGQAERLAEFGTDTYNHNLNTAKSNYENICTTHTYEQRVDTIQHAREHGMSACSGFIAGMGETDEQLVEVAFALRQSRPDSVPVNFLMPFDGTPLAGKDELTPLRCLRILAMMRLVHPDIDIRAAGGREQHLRSLQAISLEVINSLFLGDYLTSEGQAGAADIRMIVDAGFEVLGLPNAVKPLTTDKKIIQTTIRRRGIGTSIEVNA